MSKQFMSVINGMTGGMLAATIGTVVLCVFATVKLEGNRKLPSDYGRLDLMIQDSQDQISTYISAPTLPPLKDSWREVAATMKLNGLELITSMDEVSSSAIGYEGPMKSWSGYVEGEPRLVLSVLKKIQQSEPLYLFEYVKGEDVLRVNIAVVGI